MSLDDIIRELEKWPRDRVLRQGFREPHSYRGSYSELAVEPAENVSVGDMVDALKAARGTTMTGYKGGEYVMHGCVDVYIANYGECGEHLGPMLLAYMLNDTAAPRGQREGGPMGRESIFREIDEERALQDAKWGPVRRQPDVDPVLAAREGDWAQRIAEHHEIPTEERAKFICKTAEARGECSFTDIVVEELAEAVAKYRDVTAMRVELVQLAASVVKWIEAVDLDTPAHPGEGSGSDGG